MKKRIFLLLVLVFGVITISGCKMEEEETTNAAALAFKEEYESMNGKTNASGKEHRSVTISEDNPFEKITTKELLEKIDNKETFYVYFGDKLCPWCRSVIEKSIEVAKEKGIEKIYYISIWDDEGNEILRDKYELQKNKAVKTIDGTEDYYKLLEIFDGLLSDYNLTNEKGKDIKTGEKRIYAPNYIYIKDGEALKLTEGISDKQTDAREELTEEILADEQELFVEFFTN